MVSSSANISLLSHFAPPRSCARTDDFKQLNQGGSHMKKLENAGRVNESPPDRDGKSAPVWVRCRTCARQTEHDVCVECSKTAIPEEGLLAEKNGKRLLFAWTRSQIIECRACGRPSFRQAWSATPQSEDSWAWRVYSNPEYRAPLRAVHGLPPKVDTMFRELVLAFNAGAFTLAAAGLRAAIEAVCCARHCHGADLQQRIRKLKGVLSDGDIKLLQTHRALGNAAIHQVETPSPDELAAAIDVLEHLLRTLYFLPLRADDFKRLRAERISGQSLSLAKVG
jgi:uncharacterized protein DUF4145